MKDIDLTQEALAALQPSSTARIQEYHHGEIYRLLGKILGALIRRRRLCAGRSTEECANHLQIQPQLLADWEIGEQVPGLPQLELLAQFLNGAGQPAAGFSDPSQQSFHAEYVLLRQRLIGVLMRAARLAKGRSLDAMSACTALDVELLDAYEHGASMIPVSHLSLMARAVGRDLCDFVMSNGSAAVSERALTPSEATVEIESEADELVPDREQEAFIRLALAFRRIEKEHLHRIANALFAILQARDEANDAVDLDS